VSKHWRHIHYILYNDWNKTLIKFMHTERTNECSTSWHDVGQSETATDLKTKLMQQITVSSKYYAHKNINIVSNARRQTSKVGFSLDPEEKWRCRRPGTTWKNSYVCHSTYGHHMGRHVGQCHGQRGMVELDCLWFACNTWCYINLFWLIHWYVTYVLCTGLTKV